MDRVAGPAAGPESGTRSPARARRSPTRLGSSASCSGASRATGAAARRRRTRAASGLIGDVPIFVSHDGADVWSHRELFQLDLAARRVVAGVPPDYFSETGQRWGNPLYRWERMRETGYAWWIERSAPRSPPSTRSGSIISSASPLLGDPGQSRPR